ncbi:MAG: hypothetical protein BGO09_04665 [Bacteroidetes bacterium 47-18]|nr:MAG: hypothetical protein BGO09_04665 [Bacteroidetes bacterium 47-18]
MLKTTLRILTISLLSACNNIDRTKTQDYVVFENDSREKDISFKPTNNDIEKAEKRLFEHLDNLTKNNKTILVNNLDKKIPLQENLRYYKRRYFGKMNNQGEQIIEIEFVFIRCGGTDEMPPQTPGY